MKNAPIEQPTQLDSSERSRAGDALQKSEISFRQIADCLPQLVWTCRPDGPCDFLSRKWLDYTGIPEAPQLGFGWLNQLHPDDRAPAVAAWQTAVASGSDFVVEFRIRHHDGEYRWFDTRAVRLFDQEGQAVKWFGSNTDITERKNAVASLRESEEKFRNVFDNSAIGKYISDLDGTVHVNRAFCQILGYTQEEMARVKWQDLSHHDDYELTQENLRQLQSGDKEATRFTKRYFKKDGSIVWADVNTVLQRDGEGKPRYYSTAVVDITARKEAEDAVRNAQIWLTEAQRIVRLGSWQWDALNDVISGSDEFYRLFEVQPELLVHIGQFIERLHPHDRKRVEKDVADALRQDRPYATEYRVVLPNGGCRYVSARGVVTCDESGKPLRMAGTCLDITDRKKAEADSRVKDQVFEDSIASQSVADKAGVITHVNSAFLRLWGYATREQAVGKSVDSFFANPADAVPVLEALAAHDAWQGEFLARRVDGSIFVSRGFATSLRNAQGELAGYQSTHLDVTKEKDAEQRIELLNHELLRKNAELEQVVYVASHDLRSPLVNVQGFCKELGGSIAELTQRIGKADICGDTAQSIAPIITADIPEALRYIQTSAARMDSLLAGLLKVSRLGRAAIAIGSIDVEKIVEEVLRNAEYTSKQKGALIRVESPLPSCLGDSAHMGQVFANLIDNALKYLDPARPGRINISGAKANGNAVYCVEDNGIGMAPEHCEKIFEIFHRLNPNSAEGEGLGLTIVRRSLDKQGGRVWAESEPGKGSRFFVSLPAGES